MGGTWIQLRSADGQQIGAYQVKPEGPSRGGLVLVQEIFGVNEHIRGVAEGYVREGYTVIAPALFDRYEPGVDLSYAGADVQKAFALYGRLKPETALLDVAAAFEVLRVEAHGTAVVGYCYGGLMAWLSATRGNTEGFAPRCTVGYYPGGVGSVANEDPKCPVMLHFGGADSHIGMDQVEAVRSAHPEVKVFVYEGAGHAFNRDADPNAFHPEAAKLARERTLAFLAEHLA